MHYVGRKGAVREVLATRGCVVMWVSTGRASPGGMGGVRAKVGRPRACRVSAAALRNNLASNTRWSLNFVDRFFRVSGWWASISTSRSPLIV